MGAIRSNGETVSRGSFTNTAMSRFLRGGKPGISAENKIVNGLDDPSYLAFSFYIPPARTGLFGNPKMTNSYFDMDASSNYSAIEYLEGCSGSYNIISKTTEPLFYNEAVMMSQFVNGMRTLSNEYQYVFQSVDGLQDAYKKYFDVSKDTYLGSADTKIKITCLESMDLRMTALFDTYFNAVYDRTYRRQRLPRNLLEFDCCILVHDLRKILASDEILKTRENEYGKAAGLTMITNDMFKTIAHNVSSVLFTFKRCVFDQEDIGTQFSNMSNTEFSETKFDFSFKYQDIAIEVASLADAINPTVIGYSGSSREVLSTRSTVVTDNGKVNNMKMALDDAEKISNQLRYVENDAIYPAYVDQTRPFKGLNQISQSLYQSVTTGNKLGNVYDHYSSMVANIMGGITNNSTSSILNSALEHGNYQMGNILRDSGLPTSAAQFLGGRF